jgi:hypothetical protein
LYLDNKLLSSLSGHPQLPSQLLLAGAMGRLAAMDDAAASAAGLQPPPRATYCCDGRYGLPGGSRTLTLDIEDIWQHVIVLYVCISIDVEAFMHCSTRTIALVVCCEVR